MTLLCFSNNSFSLIKKFSNYSTRTVQTCLLVNISMPLPRSVVLKWHCHEFQMCEFIFSCGSFGGAAMDGADKRGRASWIDDAIKHFRVLSWSGVKHPGVDRTVEGSLCSFGREVGGSWSVTGGVSWLAAASILSRKAALRRPRRAYFVNPLWLILSGQGEGAELR